KAPWGRPRSARPGRSCRRCRGYGEESARPQAGRLTRTRAGQQITVSGPVTATGSAPPPGCATRSPRAGSRERNWTNGSPWRSTHGPSVTCDALPPTFPEPTHARQPPAAHPGARQGPAAGPGEVVSHGGARLRQAYQAAAGLPREPWPAGDSLPAPNGTTAPQT